MKQRWEQLIDSSFDLFRKLLAWGETTWEGIMVTRSKDIEELEWYLDNAGSDKELCDKAIEIADRILEGIKKLEQKHEEQLYDKIVKDSEDFEQVLRSIKRRKHEHVLDDFFIHGRKLQQEFDF